MGIWRKRMLSVKLSARRSDSRPAINARSARIALACCPMESLESRLLFSTYTVNSLADDGSAGTLRWAVDQATQNTAAPNTINFASGLSGTINLTGGELELTGGSTTILGPGAGNLAISGDGMNNVIRVDFGATADIANLTITDGAGIIGAGLDNSGATTVQDVTFSNNVASGGVGGALFSSGTLTVQNSMFVNNSASSGGAIYSNSGTLTVLGSTLIGNSTDTAGGAIYSHFPAVFLGNSTFTANPSAQGGAVFLNSGSLTAVNDT